MTCIETKCPYCNYIGCVEDFDDDGDECPKCHKRRSQYKGHIIEESAENARRRRT